MDNIIDELEKTIIKNEIKKCLSDDTLDIKDYLDFEFRKIIYENKGHFFNKFNDYKKIRKSLFTPEEALVIYNDNKDIDDIEIICHLSDEIKLSLVDTWKKMQISDLICTIKSDEIKKQAFLKSIQDKYSLSNYYEMILSFNDSEIALETIEEYIEHNENLARNFLSYEIKLEKILKETNFINTNEQKRRILNILDKYNCFSPNILDDYPDKMFLFKEIIKLPNFKKDHSILFLCIKQMKDENPFEIYDLLMENNYKIGRTELGEIFTLVEDNQKKDFINHIYDYMSSGKNIDYTLVTLLLTYPVKEIHNKMRELFKNDDRFNEVRIAILFKNEILFNCLEIAIEDLLEKEDFKNDKQKQKNYCKTFIQYFSDLEYDFEFDNDLVSCDKFIEFICQNLNLDKNNLKKLISVFGYQTFKYLNLENIRNLINTKEEEFKMILNIFDEKNVLINNHKLDSLIESVIQREFIFKEQKIYNIFSKVETMISKKEDFNNIYNQIIETVSKKRIKILEKICKENNINLQQLYENLKKGDAKALSIFHEITDNFIAIKREEYVKRRSLNIKEELDLEKKYKKEWIQKKYLEINDVNTIYYEIRYGIGDNLTKDQEKLIEDREQLENIIRFRKEPTNEEYKSKIEKKNLRIFNELLNILYEKEKLKDKSNDSNALYEYSIKSMPREALLELLSLLDIECIKNKILPNKEIYQTLLEVLNKHKYLGIGSTFNPIRDEIDLDLGNQAIIGLINNFYQIYKEYEEKIEYDEELKNEIKKGITKTDLFVQKNTMTKLLEEGFVYEMESNKYSFLIGEDNFRLFFANTGKNRSSASSTLRLQKLLEIIPKMYNKTTISVPYINQVLTLSNGKKIKVELGNALDMTNITVGERTESCLRALGAFNDLWEFCLSDKNGFNIIYKNPDNGKFVSRVSAIRNGNTVFENELRYSVLSDFSNDDIVEANKIVANILVELTRTSNSPIENVIITSDYAMNPEQSQEQTIKTDLDKPFYDLNFNYETPNEFKGIVLSNNGKLNTISPNNNDETYEIESDEIMIYTGKKVLRKIKQLKIINQLLNGIPIEDIEIPNIPIGLNGLTCIANNEFYILKKDDEIIDTFIIDKCKENKKTINYLKNVLVSQGGKDHEANRNYH